jgi:hypothetical protein
VNKGAGEGASREDLKKFMRLMVIFGFEWHTSAFWYQSDGPSQSNLVPVFVSMNLNGGGGFFQTFYSFSLFLPNANGPRFQTLGSQG